MAGSGRRPFATYNPFTKVGLWLGLVLGVGAIAWGVGLLFDPQLAFNDQPLRSIMTLVAVATIVLAMSFETRPATDFGLYAPSKWWAYGLAAFAIGAGAYLAYVWIGTSTGLVSIEGDIPPEKVVTRVASQVFKSFVSAFVVMAIFCGYLLGLFRQRYGRTVAVIVVPVLFMLLYEPSPRINVQTMDGWQSWPTPLLAMVLLCIMRLRHGDVFTPASLLIGWQSVERAIHKVYVIQWPQSNAPGGATADVHAIANWLAANQDLRQGPAMWAALGLGVVGYAIALARLGEPEPPEGPAQMSPSFKRVYPLSQPNMFAPLDVWAVTLWRARFRIDPIYIPRLICTLTISAINTVATLPERLLSPILLPLRKVPDPIFILGTHRSGTTHLHNLLSLDRGVFSPWLFHVVNPYGSLFSGWLMLPVMAACTPPERPMDRVRLNIFSANEEEFAIANQTHLSSYWAMPFPRMGQEYDRFLYPDRFTEREKKQWKKHYHRFLQRYCFYTRRRPLLKNPANTARASLLRELYPNAKFVHIRRHPYSVYRSNVRMVTEGFTFSQLQDPDESTWHMARFPENYPAMEQRYEEDAAAMPPGQCADVAFEDLERDPIGEIKRIYAQWNLPFTDEYEQRLTDYLASIAGYKKNTFKPMDPQLEETLYPKLQPLFDRWGYDRHSLDRKASPQAD